MKNILATLICVSIVLTSCNKKSKEIPADDNIISKKEIKLEPRAPIKGMCIFWGQAETFTASDWQALADSHVTDFVIIPKETTFYGDTEKGYKTKLAPFMVYVINQLVSRNEDAKIWIGTPGITSLNFAIASSSLEPIYNYFVHVRGLVGDYIWENNIGVYMNQEAVYGEINSNNPMANSSIKLMADLSHKVHTDLNSEFLWIPYYGYGKYSNDIIKGLAHVANTSTIFDFICIQPHYYFDGTIPENLVGVKHSIEKQAICDFDGSIVMPKNSKTVIGAEIELSWRITPPNNYLDYRKRYDEYLATFSEFVGKYPTIFYWDGTLKSALDGCINPLFDTKN